jgi:hypothetical protein
LLAAFLLFGGLWMLGVLALAALVPEARMPLRAEEGFVEQASWMLHTAALLVAVAVLLGARGRRCIVDWLVPPLILLGLASELSALERWSLSSTVGGVIIDAPHDLATLLIVEAAGGEPVALGAGILLLLTLTALVRFLQRTGRRAGLVQAARDHPATPFVLVALGLVAVAFAFDAVTATIGTLGFVLGVPEESLEMLAALALLVGACARVRDLRSMAATAP